MCEHEAADDIFWEMWRKGLRALLAFDPYSGVPLPIDRVNDIIQYMEARARARWPRLTDDVYATTVANLVSEKGKHERRVPPCV